MTIFSLFEELYLPVLRLFGYSLKGINLALVKQFSVIIK